MKAITEIIEAGELLHAIHAPLAELSENNKTEWFGEGDQALQASRMNYDKGKVFKSHKHKLNPRIINYTQESFVVIKGKISVNFYNKKETQNIFLGKLTAKAGDIIIIYRGFHELVIEEDETILYELKAGRFTTVQEDKEFME